MECGMGRILGKEAHVCIPETNMLSARKWLQAEREGAGGTWQRDLHPRRTDRGERKSFQSSCRPSCPGRRVQEPGRPGAGVY